MNKFASNAELYKFYTEKYDIGIIPEEPLKMTLMGCKASINSEINIMNICKYLIPTLDIPIIECPSYIILRLDIDCEKFKKKKKKYKLYVALIKSVTQYLNDLKRNDKEIPNNFSYSYDYYSRKNVIGRRGIITGDLRKRFLIYSCAKEFKRFICEMKSQIQFSVHHDEKYYNVKRFTNGSIQIPHCFDTINFTDARAVVQKLIDYENTHFNKYIYICNECEENNHDPIQCRCVERPLTTFNEKQWFTIILMNFRFVAIDGWKIRLDLLNIILLAEKERLDNLRLERCGERIMHTEEHMRLMSRPLDQNSSALQYIYYNREDINISSIKYVISNVRLTIKFYVPELKRKKLYITLTISSKGKFNLQGTLPHVSTETFYEYILDIFRTHPELFYRPAPTDDEMTIIENYERENNIINYIDIGEDEVVKADMNF